MVVEIKFAFFGRMERGGLFTVAKECNLYEFQMKKKMSSRFGVSSLFLEITLDQGPIFQVGLQSTT